MLPDRYAVTKRGSCEHYPESRKVRFAWLCRVRARQLYRRGRRGTTAIAAKTRRRTADVHDGARAGLRATRGAPPDIFQQLHGRSARLPRRSQWRMPQQRLEANATAAVTARPARLYAGVQAGLRRA